MAFHLAKCLCFVDIKICADLATAVAMLELSNGTAKALTAVVLLYISS